MLLAVRISSYGCTWEVWRALKKLELLSAVPRATLTLLSCSPNFPRASLIRYTHAKHEPILNCEHIMQTLICIMAAWTSFTRLSVKIAHFLFIFIAVAQFLQSPLSKGHQHLARKGSELQVASEFARPAVSSEGYRRSKTTSESMVSAPRRILCVVILAH